MFLGCCRDPDAVGESCVPWLRRPKPSSKKANKRGQDKPQRNVSDKGQQEMLDADKGVVEKPTRGGHSNDRIHRRTSRDYPSSADTEISADGGRRPSRYSASVAPKLKDLSLLNAAESTLGHHNATIQNGLQASLRHMQGLHVGAAVDSPTGESLDSATPDGLKTGDINPANKSSPTDPLALVEGLTKGAEVVTKGAIDVLKAGTPMPKSRRKSSQRRRSRV